MATPQQIAALYQQYLGREPDPEGLAFYSNPDFSLQLIEQDIANSAEAKGRAPLDVNALYGSLTDAEAAGLSTARDINADFPITRGGTVYNFLADGSIQVIKPSDATLEGKTLGATLAQYSPTGEVQIAPYFNADYGKQGTGDLIGKAAIATAIGSVLGPAGIGLSTPAAAAAASGATTLGTGGSVENAAKSALLGGLAAYGTEALLGSFGGAESAGAQQAAELTLVDDIVNLSEQGLSQPQITQAISQAYGVDPVTAAQSVAATLAPTGAATATQVAVTGAANPALSGTAAGGLLGTTAPTQQVQVQQGLLSQPTQAAATTAGGLIGTTQPTQTVDVQAQRQARINNLYQTILGRAPDAAGLAFYSNPQFTDAQIEADIRNSAEAQQRQQVTVPGSKVTTTTGTTAGALAGTTAGTAATQTVPVEDRSFQSQTFAPVIPVTPTQTVNVDGRGVQTATANIGPVAGGAGGLGGAGGMGGAGGSATGGQGGTATASNQLNLSLLDAAAITALMGGLNSLLGPSDQAPVVDQAALNRIINAPFPTYPRVPKPTGGDMSATVMPRLMPGGTPGGFYQIAPTGVYNPFATAAPFGAGRFGATVQPITLPGLV